MRCIFCKSETNNDKSIEHIIPESLGNTVSTLPKGIVCDRCNNYFSIKIEAPVLNSGLISNIRSIMRVDNKRGKIPDYNNFDNNLPDFRNMTRLIGKIGMEALTKKAIDNNIEYEIEIIQNKGLDELRDYVRYNNQRINWPLFYRTLYPINSVFYDDKQHFEVLNEFDLLYTEGNELYIDVILFGVEFVMNLGGPEIEGYYKWLEKHNYSSYLYSKL
jgi:hypothetical protein